MCFNEVNVAAFYRNLAALLDEFRFPPHHIWNMDETGIATVHNPGRVVAERGVRQVGKLTSADRGTITLAVAEVSCLPDRWEWQ